MLLNLHVKNLALIDEAEVYFGEGLNILTGETGAGKSIIIGSINLALGGKVSKDLVREAADYGLVELVFELEKPDLIEKIKALDIEPEDNQIILSRKIMKGRSISKVNGETVTSSVLKSIGELLIDIHGQHEHQSLLYRKKHLEILDEFGKKELFSLKEKLADAYKEYQSCKKELDLAGTDEEARIREMDFIEFELTEIKEASLINGEDEELEIQYKKMLNGKKIAKTIDDVHCQTGYDNQESAGEQIGRALKELALVTEYENILEQFWTQLQDIDGLLNDFNRELSDYAESLNFMEEDFRMTEERLNLINHLKSKYGSSISEILKYKAEKESRLLQLKNYEQYMVSLQNKYEAAKNQLKELSLKVSGIRKEQGKILAKAIKNSLIDLNFLDVQFDIAFTESDHYTSGGIDEAEFMISTSPGEKLKPLANVASGGELSRIMLAVKTVLAEKDAMDTLIFDEIDVGISGRTAQKVSEKMAIIGSTHQVICITHLPQIAAMADHHFAIEKNVKNNETITSIRKLEEKEIVDELARILGGAKITSAVIENAKEMKELATRTKLYQS